jgi:AraC-like DNA-binding protein
MHIFETIPPYQMIPAGLAPQSVFRLSEIYHGTACDVSYRSRGEERSRENHVLFHYAIRGRGEVLYQGQAYTVRSGEGFFNIVNQPLCGYGYPADGEEPWEFIVLCFTGGNARQVIAELLQHRVVYSLVEQEAAFARLCERLHQGAQSSLCALPELISLLQETREEPSRTVQLFNTLVERTLMQNPTVASIAGQMGMSREHLTRLYTAQTGESPAANIKQRRFERLCLLLAGEQSLSEIAQVMSFPSVAGMGGFFKSMSHRTLSAYRKNGYLSV